MGCFRYALKGMPVKLLGFHGYITVERGEMRLRILAVEMVAYSGGRAVKGQFPIGSYCLTVVPDGLQPLQSVHPVVGIHDQEARFIGPSRPGRVAPQNEGDFVGIKPLRG